MSTIIKKQDAPFESWREAIKQDTLDTKDPLGFEKAPKETLTERKTRLIAVTSGKGGVGKSSLSVNLGLALVRSGKKVLLFEADLGLANVNILMGIIPKYNLYHLVKDHKTLEEIIVHTPEGLDIIPGASGYSNLANMSTREREQIIDEFDRLGYYDIIVIDTGAGISSNVVDFTLPADDIIVVTTPEPTSVTDAYGIIKSIILVEPKKEITLVVNRASSSLEGRKVAERLTNICQQFLNYEIKCQAFIFNDEHVSDAVRKQKPFLILHPKGKASSCVNILASKLLGHDYNKEGLRTGSLSNVFQKLFQVK